MPCEVCGNEYDRAFVVRMHGVEHTFDSFECAMHALAPRCHHCGCMVVGHGVELEGVIFCCAHCARHHGAETLKDREDSHGMGIYSTHQHQDELVTEASEESFPASDPPARTISR